MLCSKLNWAAMPLHTKNVTMSYYLNPVEEDQCVFLTYEDEMPAVEVVSVRCEAAGLLAARHWNRMVVDITELRSVTAMELFVFARGFSSDLPRNVSVALIVRPEQAVYAQFIENIAQNDGVFVAFFFNAVDAIAWVNPLETTTQNQERQLEKNSHLSFTKRRET